jgi:hypothetical protein
MNDIASDPTSGRGAPEPGAPPDDLSTRLAALEARAPGRDDPPSLTRAARRGRLGRVALAPLLVVALVVTVGAGAVVAVNELTRGYPGIENPGQPLAGAQMECMTPPQAAAFLAAHGYTDVVWQVESGAVDPVNVDGAEGNAPKGSNTSVQQSTPPEHGYVIPGAVPADGKLHMVVDQRVGATGVGACFGMPMP